MKKTDSPEILATRPETGGRPTLKTISQLSGLAVATVSRALGDAPDISDKTKKRVRRIAAEIGYVPDRAGVRLRTGRTNVISLVLSTENDAMNLTARLISAVAGGLRETPFHLIMTPDFPDDDPMKPIRYIVETGSADAIIMNRVQPEDPRVRYLMDRGFPFATHGRTIWADEHPYFDYDNRAFGRMAVEALAARGRRKILLIAPPRDQNYAIEMIEGAQARAAALGVEVVVADPITSDSHRTTVSAYVAERLKAEPGFDGLISASPNATMAAIVGLEAAGHGIGGDFDVFSKETVPFLTMFRPGILCASEDVAKAGAFLARAAVQRAQNPDAPPMQCLDAPAETPPPPGT